MSRFDIDVQPDVDKTEVGYSGPEEDLVRVKERLSDLDGSDVYPSFEGEHSHSLFFHTVEQDDVERIRAVAEELLTGEPERDKSDEGDSARSPLYPKAVAGIVAVGVGVFLFYHYVIAQKSVEPSSDVQKMKQEMVRESSERADTEPTESSPAIERTAEEPAETSGPEASGEPTEATDNSRLSQQQKQGKAAAAQFFEQQKQRADAFPGDLKVHFLNVGQGDAQLIELPDGQFVLIDAGYARFGERVVNYLKDQGVQRLKTVVMTHPHADHIGGIRDVLNAFEVGEVWDAGVSHTSQTYKETLQLIRDKNIPYRTPKRGKTVSWGDYCRSRVLHPAGEASSDALNNASIVLAMNCNGGRFLFTGDAEKEVERTLVQSANLKPVDVLKVGHHGSHSSSTHSFLDEINARYGVISCGQGNTYGHPSPKTLQALKQFNVEVYRTDQQGHVVVSYDGDSFRVRTEQRSGPADLSDIEEGETSSSNGKIDINRAGVKQLTTLDGIGPVTATKIVDYRTKYGDFSNVDGLSEVSGIGPATLNQIRSRVKVW